MVDDAVEAWFCMSSSKSKVWVRFLLTAEFRKVKFEWKINGILAWTGFVVEPCRAVASRWKFMLPKKNCTCGVHWMQRSTTCNPTGTHPCVCICFSVTCVHSGPPGEGWQGWSTFSNYKWAKFVFGVSHARAVVPLNRAQVPGARKWAGRFQNYWDPARF